jgi:uridine phosphorylase
VELRRDQWLEALGLEEHEVPDLLVLEGSWWQRERNAQRLALLSDVRELGFPEMHLGRYHGVPVAYSCAYGAPRAVEPVHAFLSIGTSTVLQIGSCGGLDPRLRTGDILLPEVAVIGEGASQYYGGVGEATAAPWLVDRLECAFVERGFTVHRGRHVTSSALFAQPQGLIERWRESGCLGVDMETSAVLSAAASFGAAAASALFVWDELLAGRTWLDPFEPAERDRQQRANAALFEVALTLLP